MLFSILEGERFNIGEHILEGANVFNSFVILYEAGSAFQGMDKESFLEGWDGVGFNGIIDIKSVLLGGGDTGLLHW